MAAIFQAFPQLRAAAPRLSRRLFVTPPCVHSSPLRAAVPPRACPRQPSFVPSVRYKSTQPLRASIDTAASPTKGSTSIVADSAAASNEKCGSWPKTSSKSVAYWLLGSAASVFGIVVFGGLTRLTESGYAFPLHSRAID